MKTVMRVDGKIERLSDEEARALVEQGIVQYCPKSAWKALGNHGPKPNVKALGKSVEVPEENDVTLD